MPLARVGATLLFFVHVPKTGGTSVEAYLRRKGVVMLHGQGSGWSRAPLQHLHRAAYEELLPEGSFDRAFAVLRDPLARLQSEFRMRAEPLKPKFRPLGWLRAARNRAAGRPTHMLRVDGRAELHDFDSWVARVFDRWRRDPWLLSNHIRPQNEFVSPGQTLFRLEHGLEPVFRWIDAVTGTSAIPGDFHERRAAPIPITVDAATEARVRDFYRADYELLEALDRSGGGGRSA